MSRDGVKPANYGDWWNTNGKDAAWYQEIHDDREPVHEAFVRWVAEHDRPEDPVRSVLEIGCGRGVSYPARFADRRYVGYDISRKEIEWCRTHRHNPLHEYRVGDFIADGIDERFDLVFAHAVIDHVYDIDAFVRAAVNASKRWVYLTAYRGWFPDLREHRYRWSEEDTCFYNDVAPRRIQSVLTALGCLTVRVSPSDMVIEPIGRETVIVAERLIHPAAAKTADPGWLRAHSVCPACLEREMLVDGTGTPPESNYRCGRCHRVYPADASGIADFQVHDRLASLPAGALEMWALAQHRSREAFRLGSADAPAWDEMVKAFADFVALDGSRVLDVVSGAMPSPAGGHAEQAHQFVTLSARPVEPGGPATTVRAWIELIPFASGTFDVVICSRSLEQALCLDSGLRELHRVLRHGGALYLWVSLFPNAKSSREVYPPLLARSAGDILPEGEGVARRAAALDDETRRTTGLDRLETVAGHLLADRTHLRHLPLRMLKNMPRYGFQPEAIDICGHDFHDGRVALQAFVRLRRSAPGAPGDRMFLQQLDLLAETASVSEHVQGIAERLTRGTSSLDSLRSEITEARATSGRDLQSAVTALRESIHHPRTPFERLDRRLATWWRRYVRPAR